MKPYATGCLNRRKKKKQKTQQQKQKTQLYTKEISNVIKQCQGPLTILHLLKLYIKKKKKKKSLLLPEPCKIPELL